MCGRYCCFVYVFHKLLRFRGLGVILLFTQSFPTVTVKFAAFVDYL